MKKDIILASLIGLCSACNTEDSINPNVNKENPTETPDTVRIEEIKEEDIFNAESTIREDIYLGEQQQKISQKINEFSWDTFSKIFSDKEDVSLLVSPLSLNQNIMMLSNGLKGETIEEILVRTDIQTLIGGYVSLKRAGANMKGLCPFHSEKTPSFTVFKNTQTCYCFGCGSGGDVVTFIMKMENLTP